MRMRQSPAEFEAAFREGTVEEAERHERLRRQAAERSRARRQEKVHKHGTLRFIALVLTIIATSVVVTWAMFETLALVVGG